MQEEGACRNKSRDGLEEETTEIPLGPGGGVEGAEEEFSAAAVSQVDEKVAAGGAAKGNPARWSW